MDKVHLVVCQYKQRNTRQIPLANEVYVRGLGNTISDTWYEHVLRISGLSISQEIQPNPETQLH